MNNAQQKKTIEEHVAYNEIEVKCRNCEVTVIAKVADLRSNRLIRCPACRTVINELLEREYGQAAKNISSIGE